MPDFKKNLVIKLNRSESTATLQSKSKPDKTVSSKSCDVTKKRSSATIDEKNQTQKSAEFEQKKVDVVVKHSSSDRSKPRVKTTANECQPGSSVQKSMIQQSRNIEQSKVDNKPQSNTMLHTKSDREKLSKTAKETGNAETKKKESSPKNMSANISQAKVQKSDSGSRNSSNKTSEKKSEIGKNANTSSTKKEDKHKSQSTNLQKNVSDSKRTTSKSVEKKPEGEKKEGKSAPQKVSTTKITHKDKSGCKSTPQKSSESNLKKNGADGSRQGITGLEKLAITGSYRIPQKSSQIKKSNEPAQNTSKNTKTMTEESELKTKELSNRNRNEKEKKQDPATTGESKKIPETNKSNLAKGNKLPNTKPEAKNIVVSKETTKHFIRDFYCQKCGSNCGSFTNLHEHIFKTPDRDHMFRCAHCQYIVGNTIVHLILHTRRFCSREDFKRAEDRLVEENPNKNRYYCERCGKGVAKLSDLFKHYEEHKGQVLSCSLCDKTCISFFELLFHFREHTVVGNIHVTCKLCPLAFYATLPAKLHYFTVHSQMNMIVYECDLCVQVFVDEEEKFLFHVQGHSQINSNIKPGRPKRDVSKLTCEVCSEIFGSIDACNTHKKVIHNLDPKIERQCPRCMKNVTVADMSSHLLIHLKEKAADLPINPNNNSVDDPSSTPLELSSSQNPESDEESESSDEGDLSNEELQYNKEDPSDERNQSATSIQTPHSSNFQPVSGPVSTTNVPKSHQAPSSHPYYPRPSPKNRPSFDSGAPRALLPISVSKKPSLLGDHPLTRPYSQSLGYTTSFSSFMVQHKCNHCQQTFMSVFALNEHLKSHVLEKRATSTFTNQDSQKFASNVSQQSIVPDSTLPSSGDKGNVLYASTFTRRYNTGERTLETANRISFNQQVCQNERNNIPHMVPAPSIQHSVGKCSPKPAPMNITEFMNAAKAAVAESKIVNPWKDNTNSRTSTSSDKTEHYGDDNRNRSMRDSWSTGHLESNTNAFLEWRSEKPSAQFIPSTDMHNMNETYRESRDPSPYSQEVWSGYDRSNAEEANHPRSHTSEPYISHSSPAQEESYLDTIQNNSGQREESSLFAGLYERRSQRRPPSPPRRRDFNTELYERRSRDYDRRDTRRSRSPQRRLPCSPPRLSGRRRSPSPPTDRYSRGHESRSPRNRSRDRPYYSPVTHDREMYDRRGYKR